MLANKPWFCQKEFIQCDLYKPTLNIVLPLYLAYPEDAIFYLHLLNKTMSFKKKSKQNKMTVRIADVLEGSKNGNPTVGLSQSRWEGWRNRGGGQKDWCNGSGQWGCCWDLQLRSCSTAAGRWLAECLQPGTFWIHLRLYTEATCLRAAPSQWLSTMAHLDFIISAQNGNFPTIFAPELWLEQLRHC